MSSDPKGPETIPLTAEADEHEGHYTWTVEPFDPDGPLAAIIRMDDVECGQILDAWLHVPFDGDSPEEIAWAQSVAEDIAGRLNRETKQDATIARLTAALEAYDEWVLGHDDADGLLCFLCGEQGTIEEGVEHKADCPEVGRRAALTTMT